MWARISALLGAAFAAATAASALAPAAEQPPLPLPVLERTALVALYNATGGHRWFRARGWVDQASCPCAGGGRWEGVVCEAVPSASGGAPRWTVVAINLPWNGLRGRLVSFIDKDALRAR